MGVQKEYDTLGSLRVQFGIPIISITFKGHDTVEETAVTAA